MNWRASSTASLAVGITLACAVSAKANLLLNPGFESPDLVPPENQATGADDWTTFNTVGVRTARQHSGDQALRLAPNGPTGTGSGIARQEFTASANDLLSFGAWVLNPSSDPLSGDRQAELRVQWLNSGGTLINQSILKVADARTPTDLWINFKLVDLTLPDNENIAFVRPSLFVTNDGGTGGGVAFFDDAEFVVTASADAVPEPTGVVLASLLAFVPVIRQRRALTDRQRSILHGALLEESS